MENLEESWTFKMVISRNGKVLKQFNFQNLWKSHGNLLFLSEFTQFYKKKLNILIIIYSFNQTIFLRLYLCIHRDFPKCLKKSLKFVIFLSEFTQFDKKNCNIFIIIFSFNPNIVLRLYLCIHRDFPTCLIMDNLV